MDRLTFLKKARQLANEQVEASSCLTDKEFAELQQMNEEEALTKKAKSILEDAAFDIDT